MPFQEAPVGGSEWEGRENWMTDSPGPLNTSNPQNLGTGSRSLGLTSGDTSTDLQSNSNQSLLSSYALFDDQSIWSLNNSGSETSNLLSWAMLGAAERQQQEQQERSANQ